MSHPIIVVLAAVFAILGAGFGYILVRGFRVGRFSRRFTSLDTALRSLEFRRSGADGYEPGYSYRDRDKAGFWIEAAFRVFAMIICVIMFTVLLNAP